MITKKSRDKFYKRHVHLYEENYETVGCQRT